MTPEEHEKKLAEIPRQEGYPHLLRGGGMRRQVIYPKMNVRPSDLREIAAQHLINSEYLKRLGAIAAGAGRIIYLCPQTKKTKWRHPTSREINRAGDRLIKLASSGRLHVIIENGEFAAALMVVAAKYIPPDMYGVFEQDIKAFCAEVVTDNGRDDETKRKLGLVTDGEFDYDSIYCGSDEYDPEDVDAVDGEAEPELW